MIQTLIHHRTGFLIAFLFLVALTFVVNRLGLIVWIAWLDRYKGDRYEDKRRGESTREYWRLHK